MLIPCDGCRRHVRATDDACPFCHAAIPLAPLPRARVDGRLSRAAVFATAVLAAPACIVQNPPPPNYQYQQQQQPPPPPPPDYQNQDHDPDPNPDTGYAQPPPDYQPTAATGVVRGRVIDTNGQPQPGVLVELHGNGAQPTTLYTDDDGGYSFAGVPAGRYTMVVGSTRRVVDAIAGRELIVNLAVPAPPVRTAPYDRHNIPKPYGAPPARKRLV